MALSKIQLHRMFSSQPPFDFTTGYNTESVEMTDFVTLVYQLILDKYFVMHLQLSIDTKMDKSRKTDMEEDASSERKRSNSNVHPFKKTKAESASNLEPDFAAEIYAEMTRNKFRLISRCDSG